MNYGIIYKITCIKNNKSYIGKTKSCYGQMNFGAEKRFKQHKINAFSPSKKNDCPLFYRAIRKYGCDAFVFEKLLECSISDVDMFETKMISIYQSADRIFGYNIALGGKGRNVAFVPEEVRQKISAKQTSTEMNIKPIFKNDTITGYIVKRRERGKVYSKHFANRKYSVFENYNKAVNCVLLIKANKDIGIPYNKESNLPKGITNVYNRKKIHMGFKASCMINGKKFYKQFANGNFSMDTKLCFATEWLSEIKKHNYNFKSLYDTD